MTMLTCLTCGWYGYETELESKTKDLDDKDYNFCPDCGGDNFEEDEEDEEDEE